MKLVTHTIPDFRSVACGVFLPVGSSSEETGSAGLSHFLEHLIFKGSSRYDADTIANMIDSTGGEVNAYTSVEHTAFYFKVLKNDVEKILDVILDIVFNPKFDETEINRERGVVLSEIASMLDSPDDLSSNGIFRACWGDHPAARPVLGSADIIKNIEPSKIREFHKSRYLKDSSIISFCGGITEKETIDLLEKKGISVSVDSTNSVAKKIHSPTFTKKQVSKEFDSEQVYFTYAWDGLKLGSDDVEKTLVAGSILSGSYSSRLFRRLREREGLVYSVSGFSNLLTFAGLVGIHGSVPREKFQKMDSILREEVERFRIVGVTSAELTRSKSMIRGSTAISLEGNMPIMHRNGKMSLLLGEIPSIDKLLEKIESIELSEMNEFIGKTIPEDFSMSVVGKEIEKISGVPTSSEKED